MQILIFSIFLRECLTNVKQVFLLYQVGSLVILIAYKPYTLEGSLEENPLAVKLLENRLYIPCKLIPCNNLKALYGWR